MHDQECILARLLPINLLNLFASHDRADAWRIPLKCTVRAGCRHGKGDSLIQVATVAVPVFGSRVAPVFDSCTKALLIAIQHEREIERTELSLKDFSSAERLGFIKRAGVTDLICGGISELLHTLLENAGFEPSVVLKDVDQAGPGYGFDVITRRVVDVAEAGIFDPAVVQKAAAHSAISGAALALTTDVIVHRAAAPSEFHT